MATASPRRCSPATGDRVPRAFEEALDHDARRSFDGLSYSKKRRIVLSVDGAKTSVTRQRRIAKAIGELRED